MTQSERMCLPSHPAGKTVEEIPPIHDEIRDRVANLIEKLTSR